MVRIPQTLQDFDLMSIREQREVKNELIGNNYGDLCEAINPECIIHFAPVLHPNDLETLHLSRNRESRTTVISKLLSHLTRSLHRKPPYWEVLNNKVLLKLQDNTLYYAMNPWLRNGRQPVGGAAYDDGGARGQQRRGHPNLPLVFHPRPRQDPGPTPKPPYPKCMPLADTQRIPEVLSRLCDNERDWRDLAQKMGLCQGDLMQIHRKAGGGRGNIIADCLIDHLISRFHDEATVGMLIHALLEMERGKEVIHVLVNTGLIQPMGGEEGGAAGEGGGCGRDLGRVDGIEDGSASSQDSVAMPHSSGSVFERSMASPSRYVNSRDGMGGGQHHLGHNTSTGICTAAVPASIISQPLLNSTVLGRNINTSDAQSQVNPSNDPTVDVNLSTTEPIKETRQPALDNLCDHPEVQHRSRSCSSTRNHEVTGKDPKPMPRSSSLSATASDEIGTETLHSKFSSTKSVDDNTSQPFQQPSAEVLDPSTATAAQHPSGIEDKVLNSTNQLSQASPEDMTQPVGGGEGGEDETKEKERSLPGRSLKTDSDCTSPDASTNLIADGDDIPHDQQTRPGDENKTDKVIIIYNTSTVNINKAGHVQLGNDNNIVPPMLIQQDQGGGEENHSEPALQQENPEDESDLLPPSVAAEQQSIPGQHSQQVSESIVVTVCEEHPQPQHREMSSQVDIPAAASSLQVASLQPSPLDDEAHQTAVKQQVLSCNEEEEREDGEEYTQEDVEEQERSIDEHPPLSGTGQPHPYVAQTDPSLSDIDLGMDRDLNIEIRQPEDSVAHSELHYGASPPYASNGGEGEESNNTAEISEPPEPDSGQEVSPLQQQQMIEGTPRRGILSSLLSSFKDMYLSLE